MHACRYLSPVSGGEEHLKDGTRVREMAVNMKARGDNAMDSQEVPPWPQRKVYCRHVQGMGHMQTSTCMYTPKTNALCFWRGY
jgi:hypothetical protein